MHAGNFAAGTKSLVFKMGWLLFLAAAMSGCSSFHGRGIQYQLPHRYAVKDPQFLRSMGSLVGAGIVASNRVSALINGEQIFPAMLEAIRRAQRSITLETYIYWSGGVGRQFAEALAERAQAGVKVHVLIDWIGSRKVDRRDLELMRRAGVEVEKYNPLVWFNLARLNHRDHRKLLIVDGQVGFIGGAGLADLWQGNADQPGHWRDTQFRLEGPAVGQMQAAFMDNWMKTTGRVLDGDEYFPELQPTGNHFAQVFVSSPRDGTETVRLVFCPRRPDHRRVGGRVSARRPCGNHSARLEDRCADRPLRFALQMGPAPQGGRQDLRIRTDDVPLQSDDCR